MITDVQKQEILALIDNEAKVLGSYNKLANKLNISSATISNNLRRPDNWGNVKDDLWVRIGKVLGYKFARNGWQVVETENLRLMQHALRIAQEECMFLAVSEKAGSGKSEAIERYKALDETNSVFVLECDKWGRQRFLVHLSVCLGIRLESERMSAELVSEKIVTALRQKVAMGQPLLIIDQANSLKPSALMWLIHLYNKLEDEIGVLVCGTEHLKDNIKKGVLRHVEGYDELDSRLGRNYIKLLGFTRQDVTNIANANGLMDETQIERLWINCGPKEVVVQGKYVAVVEDGRALKRKVIAATRLNR